MLLGFVCGRFGYCRACRFTRVRLNRGPLGGANGSGQVYTDWLGHRVGHAVRESVDGRIRYAKPDSDGTQHQGATILSYTIDESSLLVVSGRSLRVLAAVVWYVGGMVLLLKGGSLLVEANALKPEEGWPWLAAVGGLVLGGLKAKYLFNKSCQENLDRIAALDRPRIWQFFRPGFFVALAVMILVGATLSRLAHNHYPLLIGVATLDLGLAIALLGSSHVFWKQKAVVK